MVVEKSPITPTTLADPTAEISSLCQYIGGLWRVDSNRAPTRHGESFDLEENTQIKDKGPVFQCGHSTARKGDEDGHPLWATKGFTEGRNLSEE